MTAEPFAPRSIALGLSPVGESGRAVVTRLADEARAAEEAGFDGVTLSEHHAGFAHYLPSPLVVAAQLLPLLGRAWAAACPAILPLRRPIIVAEDLAWVNAVHPGRVGAGFVAGYQKQDFDVVGVDFETRDQAFWAGLEDIVTALGTGPDVSPIKADPAIADLAGRGIPLLAGVGGRGGVRRAARVAVGLLLTSLRTPDEAGQLVRAYTEAGGSKPAVLIRRVHVGADAVGFGASTAAWLSRSDAPSWLNAADTALINGTPDEVASGLVSAVRASGCGALNLRLDAYTGDPSAVAGQIAALGADVLPRVRAELGWTDRLETS